MFIAISEAAASTQRFPPTFTNFYQSATSASPGQTASFDVTALDSQASALTFTWTANVGSLATAQSTATTSRIVWTAPACAPAGAPPTVTATVTNAYGLSASKPFSLSGLLACPADAWTTARTMSTSRHRHTHTLLLSGKVLVTGGLSNSGIVSSTDVYDPATNSWSPAAPMGSIRISHTATRLPSGKVLVAGGYNGNVLTTAELYNPATNSWSSAPNMASGRAWNRATLLPSGQVLVSGGYTNNGSLSSAELYSP